MHSGYGTASTLKLDRRKFLAAAAGLVAAGLLPKSALALAGPHTFKHGTFDLTVVSDGTFDLPIALINGGAKPEDVRAILGLAADAQTNSVEISPLVIRSGSEVILIDTGTGGGMGPTAGMLGQNLKAAAVDPASITKVVYTHAHPDHLWGTMGGGGKPIFANASFHISEDEWNFWAMPDLASKMPKDLEAMVKNTQNQLAALKDKMVMFKPGTELVSGINVIDTRGHTPGHVSFELAGGDGLILVGDVIGVPKVYFANPDWTFAFDVDQAGAAKMRRTLLDMAASGKKLMLGYHWPYPGLGRAEKKDGAFTYVPA
jgi:glyoxylase-like metal-dependent hydrolase (beta-lactamase superfamily II)